MEDRISSLSIFTTIHHGASFRIIAASTTSVPSARMMSDLPTAPSVSSDHSVLLKTSVSPLPELPSRSGKNDLPSGFSKLPIAISPVFFRPDLSATRRSNESALNTTTSVPTRALFRSRMGAWTVRNFSPSSPNTPRSNGDFVSTPIQSLSGADSPTVAATRPLSSSLMIPIAWSERLKASSSNSELNCWSSSRVIVPALYRSSCSRALVRLVIWSATPLKRASKSSTACLRVWTAKER